MKGTMRRRSGQAARAPREIRVRMSAPRPAESQPDVWVVNGRVIRFLDPSRPDDFGAESARRGFGHLFSALRPGRARREGHARG